jgi:hypothetical protein
MDATYGLALNLVCIQNCGGFGNIQSVGDISGDAE